MTFARVERRSKAHNLEMDLEMDAAKSHILLLPHASVRSRTPPPSPIFLNPIPIPVSNHTVLLGVTLDSILSFHQHISASVAKATKAIRGITHPVTCTKGISAQFTRQLVVACVYTCSD